MTRPFWIESVKPFWCYSNRTFGRNGCKTPSQITERYNQISTPSPLRCTINQGKTRNETKLRQMRTRPRQPGIPQNPPRLPKKITMRMIDRGGKHILGVIYSITGKKIKMAICSFPDHPSGRDTGAPKSDRKALRPWKFYDASRDPGRVAHVGAGGRGHGLTFGAGQHSRRDPNRKQNWNIQGPQNSFTCGDLERKNSTRLYVLYVVHMLGFFEIRMFNKKIGSIWKSCFKN